MADYFRNEGFLLESHQGLIIIPVFICENTDPILDEFIKNYFPDKKDEILGQHEAADLFLYSMGEDLDYLLYYLPQGRQGILKQVFIDLENEILHSRQNDITIGLFGESEYGYDETDAIYKQELWLKDLVRRHPEKNIEFIIPDIDHRPQRGEHLSNNPISEEEVTEKDTLSSDLDHHVVQLDFKRIKSYKDYFREYIENRSIWKDAIRSQDDFSIYSVKDLGYALTHFLNPTLTKPYPMTKWAKPQLGKDGKEYAPKPSKELLKLIIILLDMSYDEAVSCLFFFGYGLARFDKEDMAFEFMLKNWPKPIDPRKADKTLIKRFGRKASIISNK